MSHEGFLKLARAYEGFEAPAQFPDQEALIAYRSEALKRSAIQADFLQETLPQPSHVVEVGCGNGRLLIELARRGTVDRGLGVDLAETRIEFARDWAKAEGLDGLEFLARDILEADLPLSAFDAAVCVTGAFNYFEAAAPGAGRRLVHCLGECLASKGILCLELYCHREALRLLGDSGGNVLQTWLELPSTDPWRFYLSRVHLESERILSHEKVFIHRESGAVDAGRKERLFLYTAGDVEGLLAGAGFSGIELWDGWTGKPYDDGELMVVTARAR